MNLGARPTEDLEGIAPRKAHDLLAVPPTPPGTHHLVFVLAVPSCLCSLLEHTYFFLVFL